MWVGDVQTSHGYPMLVSTTVDRCREAHAGRAWARCWAISRGYPTLTVEHMQGLLELCWRQPSIRRFYVAALAFWWGRGTFWRRQSSRTSGWSICAITELAKRGLLSPETWQCNRPRISLKTSIDVPMLGDIIEQNGDGLLEESHMQLDGRYT